MLLVERMQRDDSVQSPTTSENGLVTPNEQDRFRGLPIEDDEDGDEVLPDAHAFKAGPASPSFYRILPVIFAVCLAVVLPTSTNIELIRLTVCRRWYGRDHDDAGGPISGEMCTIPEVVAAYAATMTMFSFIEHLEASISFGAINLLGKKHGRKPVLFGLTSILFVGEVLYLMAASAESRVAYIYIFASVVISRFASLQCVALLGRLYVADVTAVPQRAFAFSLLQACFQLGMVPSYFVGGIITRAAGSFTSVYYLSLALQALVLVSQVFFLPESFPAERRAPVYRQMEEETDDLERRLEGTGVTLSVMAIKMLKPVIEFLQPLRVLIPRRDPTTGVLIYHLSIAAVATFIWTLATGYTGTAIVLRVTSSLHARPDETGFYLSVSAASQAVFLGFLFPFILRHSQQWVARRFTDEGVDAGGSPVNAESATIHVQLGIVITSFIWEAAAMTIFGVAETSAEVVISIMLLSFGSGGQPALYSLVVSSVDPLHKDDVLSAITIVESFGKVSSILTIGAVMSRTISVFPLAAYLTASGLCLTAVLALLFYKIPPARHVHI